MSHNSTLTDPIFSTDSVLSLLSPYQPPSASSNSPNLLLAESNLSLTKSLDLPSSYSSAHLKQLRKSAFRVNRKILKRIKKERERNHQKLAKTQDVAPLAPLNLESDAQLYNSFIMIPNQYVTYQTQENSLLLQAASIEPGTTHVEMPDLKVLDQSRESVWRVEGGMEKMREEWVKSRKEMIEEFGER